MKIKKYTIILVNIGTDSAFRNELRDLYNYPPYGLLSIASVLKSHGYDVNLIDLFSETLNREMLVEKVQNAHYDVLAVGITAYTEICHLALEVAKLLKNALPRTKVIIGGPHATFLPDEMLSSRHVDYVVKGEGESTIIPLLEYIKYQSYLNPQDLKGVSYKDNSSFKTNENREFIKNVDNLPLPAFHILRKKAIYTDTISVVSSRGCPGKCAFCASRAFSGPKYRMHSAEWLFSLLFYYKERIYEFKTIVFLDDTFTANRKRLKLFAKCIKSVGWKMCWSCKSRADTLNEDLIKLLAQSGCASIHVGIESGDQGILDSVDKNISLEKCLESVGLLRKYNIRLECSFILGLPEETPESIGKTVILAAEINTAKIGMAFIAFATPFPGTKMYKQILDHGFKLRTKNWRNYNTFKPIFDTDRFTIQDLRKAYYCFNNTQELQKKDSIIMTPYLRKYRENILKWVQDIR